MGRKYNDLIGDILENAGEKDNYKGKGKPIPKDHLKMDTYQRFQQIAKEAGYLPEWLKLQKEISQLVHQCKTEQDVQAINRKITKYNTIAPSQLQKNQISLEELEKAKRIW